MLLKERVRDQMKKCHLTSYRQLTKAAQEIRPTISYSTVWDAINSEKREASLDVIQTIATVLKTSASYLMGETDQVEPLESPHSPEALDMARRVDALPAALRAVVKQAFDDLMGAFEVPASKEIALAWLTLLFEDASEEEKTALESALSRWETRQRLRIVPGAPADRGQGPGGR